MRRYAAEVNNVFRRVRVEDYGTVELVYTYSMNGYINGRGICDAAIVGVDSEGGWSICWPPLDFERTEIWCAGDECCVRQGVGYGIYVLVVRHGVGGVRRCVDGVGRAN